MTHPILLTIHLFAAIFFIGVVFFEVLMLEPIRHRLPRETMKQLETEVGARATRLMPWVLLALFAAGLGMAATTYRGALAAPLVSSLGMMLWLKIALAFSVLGHFFAAMVLRVRGQLNGRISRRIHLSVFAHMIAIVLLAKWMFHLG